MGVRLSDTSNNIQILNRQILRVDTLDKEMTQAQSDIATLKGLPIMTGTGTPVGLIAAPVGTLYLRLDGGTSTTLYVKETGGASASGWVAK